MSKRKSQSPDIHALLQDGFSKETARELYAQGEEIAIFVMMQLAALAKKSVEVNGVHPSEPSGTVATYLKEPAKKRRKKPGAKPGHQGSHRPPPENITHHVKHIAKCCPYYVIDKSRGSPVVKRFFRKAFDGILITDFWGAYNAVVCAGKQKCLSHLLGDLKKVAKYKDKSGDWPKFSKRLKRILRDAMRLRGKRSTLEKPRYERLCLGIENRLTRLIADEWKNVEAKRLVKRLKRHRDELLVFLYHANVPFENNHAERTIRGGVVMRKNSYCNRSIVMARKTEPRYCDCLLRRGVKPRKTRGFVHLDETGDSP